MKIEQFDTVTWTSQAQGCSKTKTGIVMQVVHPGLMPDRERFKALYTGAGVGSPRNHESYVVSVDMGKSPGKSIRYYWPRVSALAKIDKPKEDQP